MPDTAIIIEAEAVYTLEIDTRLIFVDPEDWDEQIFPDRATVHVTQGRITRIDLRGPRVLEGRPARDRGCATLTGLNLTGLGRDHKTLIDTIADTIRTRGPIS